jgi:hypothetical protein
MVDVTALKFDQDVPELPDDWSPTLPLEAGCRSFAIPVSFPSPLRGILLCSSSRGFQEADWWK